MISPPERRKVLQMVQDGKISAGEAASLLRALEADDPQASAGMELLDSEGGAGIVAPEFGKVRQRARRLAMIPLWIGVLLTLMSAWGLYSVQQRAGLNVWFILLMVPLLLGVLLIALRPVPSRWKWLYLNVDRPHAAGGPRHVSFGVPLPLGLAAWLLRNFGHKIHGLRHTPVDQILQVLDATRRSDAPLIIRANDGKDGEHVQLYLG